jgi:hypothetical protein
MFLRGRRARISRARIGYGVFSPIDRRRIVQPLFGGRTRRRNRSRARRVSAYPALDDDSLPNGVEDDFGCVVQIEFLHEIRPVGLDR